MKKITQRNHQYQAIGKEVSFSKVEDSSDKVTFVWGPEGQQGGI